MVLMAADADRIHPALGVVAPYQEVGFYRAICFCSSFVVSSFSEDPLVLLGYWALLGEGVELELTSFIESAKIGA